MYKYFVVLLLVMNAGFSSVASAEQSFRVTWPVANRSDAQQKSALEQAFKEIIVRTSGTQRALDAFYVQESYQKAASFLRTFAYQKNPNEDDTEHPYVIVFTFEKNAIMRLLQDSAVPLWSGSKPITVAWLAFEENFDRQVISSETDGTHWLKQSFTDRFNRRGLPFVLPLMDLEDSMQLSASDVWGRFPDPIMSASERYGGQAVVAGRVAQINDAFEGRFFLNIDGNATYQDITADTIDRMMQEFAHWVGESLCDIYCVTETFAANNQRYLLVEDVGSFYSYRALLSYLERLSAIRRAEITQVKGRRVLVKVDLVGDVSSMIQAIELDRKLVQVSEPVERQALIDFLLAKPEAETGTVPSPLDPLGGPDVMKRPSTESGISSDGSNEVGNAVTEPSSLEKLEPAPNIPGADWLVYRWRP